MKAAVLQGPRDFKAVEMSDPKLDPDGIIVRVKAIGICGSELPLFENGLPRQAVQERGLEAVSMSMLGHEWSGEVVEVGANVTHTKVGDRVLQGGYGGFVEYYATRHAMKIPDDWPFEIGATVEPVGIGVALVTKAEPQAGDTVAVLGAGMIGQGTWQVMKAMGAGSVIVTDLEDNRLAAAKALGADMVINANKEDVVEKINEATSGLGVDIVAVCCSAPEAYHEAFEVVRGGGLYQMNVRGITAADGRPIDAMSPGGKVVVVAVPGTIEWQPSVVFMKALKIIGSWGGMGKPAFDLMQEGKVKTASLISHEFSLDNINEAFEMALTRHESIKVLVKP